MLSLRVPSLFRGTPTESSSSPIKEEPVETESVDDLKSERSAESVDSEPSEIPAIELRQRIAAENLGVAVAPLVQGVPLRIKPHKRKRLPKDDLLLACARCPFQ